LPRFQMLLTSRLGPGHVARLVDPTTLPGSLCLPPQVEIGDTDEDLQVTDRLAYRRVTSVFASTKYVRRQLSDKEWLSCFDCPAVVLQTLSTSAMKVMSENI